MMNFRNNSTACRVILNQQDPKPYKEKGSESEQQQKIIYIYI